MAKTYAKRKGFARYLATSSLLGENVKTVFDEAIELTFMNRKEKMRDLDHNKAGRDASQGHNAENQDKKKKCTIF